jgi:hypothetical protein
MPGLKKYLSDTIIGQQYGNTELVERLEFQYVQKENFTFEEAQWTDCNCEG